MWLHIRARLLLCWITARDPSEQLQWKAKWRGSEGSDTGSITQSSEGNSQGKLAISEAVEVKVIWLILQETLEDLTAADSVIFDNFTSYLLFKSLINSVLSSICTTRSSLIPKNNIKYWFHSKTRMWRQKKNLLIISFKELLW